MDFKQRMQQLQTEAKTLREKSVNHPSRFTEADVRRADEIVEEHEKLEKSLKSQADLSAKIAAIKSPSYGSDDSISYGEHKGGMGSGTSSKTTEFVGSVSKAFEEAAPMVGGPAVSKALISSGSVTAGFTGQIVAELTARQHLLFAVSTDPEFTFSLRSTKTHAQSSFNICSTPCSSSR